MSSNSSSADRLEPGERAFLAVLGLGAVAAAVPVWLRHGSVQQVGDLIAGISILTGFLFAQLLFVFQLRLRITDSPQIQSYGSVRRLINAAFRRSEAAVLAALATSVTAVCADAFSRSSREGVEVFPGRWWAAALVLEATLTIGLVLMSIWDLHRAYRQTPG